MIAGCSEYFGGTAALNVCPCLGYPEHQLPGKMKRSPSGGAAKNKDGHRGKQFGSGRMGARRVFRNEFVKTPRERCTREASYSFPLAQLQPAAPDEGFCDLNPIADRASSCGIGYEFLVFPEQPRDRLGRGRQV